MPRSAPISPSSSRVLFLEHGGVLVTRRAHLVFGRPGSARRAVDPVAARALQEVCACGASIVCIATSRFPGDLARQQLEDAALTEFLHPDWSAPATLNKADGVRAWLQKHPEVIQYRIVDEDATPYTADQQAQLIKCDPENGLGIKGIINLFTWVAHPRWERLYRTAAST